MAKEKEKVYLNQLDTIIKNPPLDKYVLVYTENKGGHKPVNKSKEKITLKQVVMMMNEGFKHLDSKMDAGFKQVNTRIDKVEKRLDNMEVRIDKIEKRLDYNDIKLERIEKCLDYNNLKKLPD